ncbi:M3 family oligoendopeptidase [Baekduia sp. Peel2402]|uniref:M3 family oligoendopeptidase n=1 Tax=Baekduia sp. Peel2402 TaxID=3458296 RepID=UPI00403EA9DE
MSTTALESVAWDLDPLVGGDGEAGADRLLDEADRRATDFQRQHAGKVADLDGPGLAAAVAELAEISELAGRAGNYAMLRFAVDTADPANGALLMRVQEKGTAIETQLLFFDLEWAALPDERAEELLGADGLDQARHHLTTARRYRPHLLTEAEEKIVSEKSVTGSAAWSRLFSEVTSAIKVELDGEDEPVALDVALSRLMSPDRTLRAHVAERVTEALQPTLRIRAYIYNTLMADKATEDRLREFPSWISSRNLSNEASDESVAALVEAVREAYEIPRRWYRLKARLLGVERLADYDRMASVSTEDEKSYDWDEAKDIVLSSFGDFSDVLADGARRFFDENWIDAPVRPAKRGGAFCAYTVPSVHPYVMLNYTSQRRDVLTLAHELGHGLHAYLARDRGVFEQHTPLTLAETASVFGETLVFARLLDQAQTPESRLALLAENIEGSIATVFRQVAMNRFEDLAHTARRGEGELSVDRISELWVQSQEELLGDAVEVTEGYKHWWSYVPHFIGTPGYVYAYAYGQLLALSVYGKYLEEGESFVPKYVELLSAGGSKSPEELAAIAGLDLTDPGFWRAGLDLVKGQLEQAEAAAEEVLAKR